MAIWLSYIYSNLRVEKLIAHNAQVHSWNVKFHLDGYYSWPFYCEGNNGKDRGVYKGLCYHNLYVAEDLPNTTMNIMTGRGKLQNMKPNLYILEA